LRLFLDANVIFTAAYSADGVSAAFFELAGGGLCGLCSSRLAVEEARRNIRHKAPERERDLESLLPMITLGAEPTPEAIACTRHMRLAEKDVPIMAAAVASDADVLVTGDRRDFGHVLGTTMKGVRVLLPRQALDLVLRGDESGG
jgi:predicted nucleic acid-binding protein